MNSYLKAFENYVMEKFPFTQYGIMYPKADMTEAQKVKHLYETYVKCTNTVQKVRG